MGTRQDIVVIEIILPEGTDLRFDAVQIEAAAMLGPLGLIGGPARETAELAYFTLPGMRVSLGGQMRPDGSLRRLFVSAKASSDERADTALGVARSLVRRIGERHGTDGTVWHELSGRLDSPMLQMLTGRRERVSPTRPSTLLGQLLAKDCANPDPMWADYRPIRRDEPLRARYEARPRLETDRRPNDAGTTMHMLAREMGADLARVRPERPANIDAPGGVIALGVAATWLLRVPAVMPLSGLLKRADEKGRRKGRPSS